MSPTVTTFLFETANFLVLAAVLGWLFFRPVRQALADRRERLIAEERQAAEKLGEAREVEQKIASERAKLQADLNELRSRELDAAHKQADQLLSDARAAAEREMEASRRQAARLSDTQRDRLALAAAASAAETVGQLLRQIDGPDVHQALVQSACRQLDVLPHDALLPVKVESARPLAPHQRAALDEALGAAATSADYRIAEEIGSGVRISSAQGLIDASTSGLTDFARQALLKEMNHRISNHNSLLSSHDE